MNIQSGLGKFQDYELDLNTSKKMFTITNLDFSVPHILKRKKISIKYEAVNKFTQPSHTILFIPKRKKKSIEKLIIMHH